MNYQTKLAVTAFAGLLSGLTSIATPSLDAGHAALTPLGEKDGCKGKDGCGSKDGCHGKDGTGGQGA
jgi:hypothetical protein